MRGYLLLSLILILNNSESFAQHKTIHTNEFLLLGFVKYTSVRKDVNLKNILFDQYSPTEKIFMPFVDSLIKVTYSNEVYKNLIKTKNEIYSDFLSNRFRNFYDFGFSWTAVNLERKEGYFGILNEKVFDNDEQKRAFIAGVFLRYGHYKDTVYQINIYGRDYAGKADLTIKFLKNLGHVVKVKRNIDPKTLYTNSYLIEFFPDNHLLNHINEYLSLNIKSRNFEKEYYDKIHEINRLKREKINRKKHKSHTH